MELTFTLQGEYMRTWRYGDPFVGEMWLRKVELPNPPPERITLTVSWAEQEVVS